MKIRIRLWTLTLISLFSLFAFAAHADGQEASTSITLAVISGGTAVTSVASGSVVALTATVKSGSATVTVGLVSFCDASAAYCTDIHLLGTAQLTSAGTAVLKFVPSIGTHSYKAVFAGTPKGATAYAGSASSDLALSVTGTFPTATTIAASGSVGNYSLTATVAATSNALGLAPIGTVSFLDTTSNNRVLGTAMLGTRTTVPSFLNSSTPPAGDLAWSAAVGDFNGDGIPDLAVANYGDGTVSILLGNGDGTFTPAADSPVSVTFDPESIVVADFNGDGKADLAMENSYYNGVVTVLLGNGDGTFTSAPDSPITVGGDFLTPGAVAVGDFNGDGIPDLVATNSNNVISEPGVMTVLLGKGDGTFSITANSPVTVGSAPISIAVGDFNGDGILDLAMVNFAGNNVTILLGKGDGTFTAASNSPVAVGSFPTSIAMGDFNADGIPDLVVANSTYTSDTVGSVTVLLGNGDGTFTPATNSPAAVGNDPWSVVAGDFNGDGKADLAVANNSDDTVTILLGSGNGHFTQASNSPVRVGNFPQSEAVGDFNGDGLSDLAVANSGSSTNTVLLSQLSQTLTATATGISPLGTGSHMVDASYTGDSSFGASVSTSIGLTAVSPPSFALSGTAITIAPGAITGNTSTVTVTPTGGFAGNVSLTAAVTASPAGAQDLPTLIFGSTSPVTIASASAGTATLTISTTAATSGALAYPARPLIRWYTAGGTTIAFVLLIGIPARGRSRWTRLGLLFFLVTLVGSFVACGGSSSSGGGGGGNPGTTPGTYTVTVTGTSVSTTAMGTFTLTVR
jgi:hypothetical protein